MFYVKNVPVWERWLRIMMGVALLLAPIVWLDWGTLGIVLGAMGAMGVMTGLMGYCPVCALAGRKLEEKK
ncbi:MAG: DUF2892 domain-containing protein [Methylophilaceae bacterium]|nr:DUF2892 domain-containing protein [Methylophilaceae bacterium]